MTVGKAVEIFKTVSRVRGLHADSVVKIEYSAPDFHKAQLDVRDIRLEDDFLIVDLYVVSTDCKAKDVCGVIKVQGYEEQGACTPGGGCC